MPDFHPILAVLGSIRLFYINPTDNRHKKVYQNNERSKT